MSTKRFVGVIAVLTAALVVAAGPVVGATLLGDDFEYGTTAGILTTVSGGNWTAHSGAGSSPVGYQTTSLFMVGYAYSGNGGAATIVNPAASGEDVNRVFAAQSGDVYFAALVNISSCGAAGAYFLHLKDTSTGFRGKVYAKDDAGVLRFALTASSNTPTYPAVAFSFNTTYLIVARYNRTTGAAAMHVLSSVPATEPASPFQTDNATHTADMSAIAIRQNTGGPAAVIDGIRVGTTWADTVVGVTQPDLSVSDAEVVEGNSGTVTASFTVSLSSPAPVGGVTFDIATADGTATTADNDYVGQSLAGQNISEGQQTYTFDVTVNGDTTIEPDESFFVNVTNVIGASVTDGQGQGTILNDDSPPNLSVDDVTLAEGDSGTTTFTFTVSLSRPADAGGVTFDIYTTDGTATTADNDYVASSLLGQTIPASQQTYSFDVTVNGDTTYEPDETFFVNVTNVVGATVVDPVGMGTISNDDPIPIHLIQGNGATSPLTGSAVTTIGVVTGQRYNNGFFLQTPDADVDTGPGSELTSEGIFVFTSSAPPAQAAVGNLVKVTGTVAEYVPSADPLHPPMTELTSPGVVQVSTGNPLPAPVALDLTFPGPLGAFDQLERLEGMRVGVASLTVVGPTSGNISETNATATSNGIFYGVVTGQVRPVREGGIQDPDPPPAGSIPPIPRFDTNPEVIRVASRGQVGATAIDVSTGAVVTGIVGPLDYAARRYTVMPDPATPPTATGGAATVAVWPLGEEEITVASLNARRFFDTVNDPTTNDAVPTTTAYQLRLGKISDAVRTYLQFPDIIGVQEVENLTTLADIAAKISADALAASQPDPLYAAYLTEGNDTSFGLDVGFLVKTAFVYGSTPRVTVNAVVQENGTETWVDPQTGASALLNDLPPLRLDATVNFPDTSILAITVANVEQCPLTGIGDPATPTGGLCTNGYRVRAKRQAQAVSLANLIQARQVANPAERIAVLGNFNAYEVNDGYVDVMGTVAGTPVPDDETVVAGDGIDLVNPDLVDLLITSPAAESYSDISDGNLQSLDHLLVNAPLVADTTYRRLDHARYDADFPVVETGSAGAVRLSDRDPIIAHLHLGTLRTLTVILTGTGSGSVTSEPPAIDCGTTCAAQLPDGMSVELTPTPELGSIFAGWSGGCSGTGACSVLIDGDVVVEAEFVNDQADLSVTKVDDPDPVTPGGTLTYTISVSNNGPNASIDVTVTDTLPAGVTFVDAVGAGWVCDSTGLPNVVCTMGALAVGPAPDIVITVNAPTAVLPFSNTVVVSSTTFDPVAGNNTDTEDTTVTRPFADLGITKDDGVTSAIPGQDTLTYTIVVSNAGPDNEGGATVTDVFPADLTCSWTCVPTGAATCTAGPVSGNINDIAAVPMGDLATYTAVCTIADQATGILTNTAAVQPSGVDSNPANNVATDVDELINVMDLWITKTDGIDLVMPGATVTYDIQVGNLGPHNATGVAVNDFFPASLNGVGWTCDPTGGGTCPASGSGNINVLVDLPTGTSVLFHATGDLDPAALGTLVNTASIDPSSFGSRGIVDPDFTNNVATDIDTIQPPVDIYVFNKTAGCGFLPGDTVTYTIAVGNYGPGSVSDVQVTDNFPATLTGVAWTCVGSAGGSCPASGSGNISQVVGLPSGAWVTFTVTGTLDPAATVALINTVQAVSPVVADLDLSNNAATHVDSIVASLTEIIFCDSVESGNTSAWTNTVP